MAFFAEIDTDGIVLRVLAVHDDDQPRGQEFLADDLNLGGTWIETSYDGSFRHNYASIDGIYDEGNDAFHKVQPFPSWALDEDFVWQPPTPYPSDTFTMEVDGVEQEIPVPYKWDEDTTSWVSPTA